MALLTSGSYVTRGGLYVTNWAPDPDYVAPTSYAANSYFRRGSVFVRLGPNQGVNSTISLTATASDSVVSGDTITAVLSAPGTGIGVNWDYTQRGSISAVTWASQEPVTTGAFTGGVSDTVSSGETLTASVSSSGTGVGVTWDFSQRGSISAVTWGSQESTSGGAFTAAQVETAYITDAFSGYTTNLNAISNFRVFVPTWTNTVSVPPWTNTTSVPG